jgi:hypothetical protein
MVESKHHRCRQRFGRDPGPNDPVFFDPHSGGSEPVAITEEQINREIRDAFIAAKTPPELVYASEKTGLFPSEKGYRRMSPQDRAEWNAAIAEYFALEKEAGAKAPH